MEIEVQDVNFGNEVLKSEIPVLVDFWAPWCMPCRMIAPYVELIANQYKEKLKVCKVNVDECPETASAYNITSIPTLIVFRDGKAADQVIGAIPMVEIEKMVKPFIG